MRERERGGGGGSDYLLWAAGRQERGHVSQSRQMPVPQEGCPSRQLFLGEDCFLYSVEF